MDFSVGLQLEGGSGVKRDLWQTGVVVLQQGGCVEQSEMRQKKPQAFLLQNSTTTSLRF